MAICRTDVSLARLGLAFVCAGITAVLVRFAIVGF